MKRLLILLGALVCTLVLMSCSNQTEDEDNMSDKQSSTLTIGIPTDMISLDIHDHNNTLTESIHSNMFNYLFKRDEDGNIHPELVDTYENIDDVTWEFTLREGVKFHNGDELTAEDVKFTLERVAYDDSLREHFFYNQIKEVEIIDDYTFKIITHEPEPVLLNRLSRIGSSILPAHYIEKNGWDYFYDNPVGTGPFSFVKWNKDQEVILDVFDDYYEGKNEDWETVIFRVIPEDTTRVAELLTGGIDLALNIPDHEWDRVNENDDSRIETTVSQRVATIAIRMHDEYATSDQRVREAIDLAIDNEALTENVLGGGATPTRTRVTPGNNGANEDLFDTYVYDPERAKQLLKEAGYEDGLEMTIHGPNGRYAKDRDIQEMIAGMLADVGITVHVDLLEWSNFVELRNAIAYEEAFFIAYGNSQFDASLAVDSVRSSIAMERHGYKNEEIDDLITKAGVNMDLDERAEQYSRVQEIIAEERPYIYLYAESNNYGVNNRIDFSPRSDEMLFVQEIVKNK